MLPFPYSCDMQYFFCCRSVGSQYDRLGQHRGKKLCVQRVLQNGYVSIKKPQTMLNHNTLFWGGRRIHRQKTGTDSCLVSAIDKSALQTIYN